MKADVELLRMDATYYWRFYRAARIEHQKYLLSCTSEALAFRKDIMSHANSIVQDIWKFCQHTFDIDLPIDACFDWDGSRKMSRGGISKGKPFITIAMVLATIPVPFREYEYYNLDKDIGFYECWDSYTTLALHILHEVSHSVQYTLIRRGKLEDTKAHGEGFRKVYRYIRTSYFNGDIKKFVENL